LGAALADLPGRFLRLTGVWLLLTSPLSHALALNALADSTSADDDAAIRKLITDYRKAIQTKDLALFKTVKQVTDEEERRVKRAFESIKSQEVEITVLAIDVKGDKANVKATRRDVIDGSFVASFPQNFVMSKGARGWSITEITK